jgi:transcriptional regulator with XRE-family HTH domain
MAMTLRFSGKKLREFRLSSGLTQAELARRANVRERQIIRWENDQNAPRSGAVMVLGQVLGQPSDSFFTDENGSEEDDEEADPMADLVTALRAFVRAELRDAA